MKDFVAKNSRAIIGYTTAFLIGTIMGKFILIFAFIVAIAAAVVLGVSLLLKESDK